MRAAAILVLVVVGAGAVAWIVDPSVHPSADTEAVASVPDGEPNDVEEAAAGVRPSVAAASWWRETEARARVDLGAGDWLSALARLTEPEGARHLRLARVVPLRALEADILAAAAPRSRGRDGIRAVLAGALAVRDDPDAGDVRHDSATRAIAWATSRVLEPYGEDRAAFTRAYRDVRFGRGALDESGGSLVRHFRFADAARELESRRGEMLTWCYEQRVATTCRHLERLDAAWSDAVTSLARVVARSATPAPSDLVDAEAGDRVAFDLASPPDRKGVTLVVTDAEGRRAHRAVRWSDIPPRRVFEGVFLPRLRALPAEVVADLAAIAVELGEADAAARFLASVSASEAASRKALDAELAALRALAATCGRTVPRNVRGAPALEPWVRRFGDTGVAHTILGFGVRDLGTFDDDAVRAYVAGGITWAPEQWRVQRERLLAVVPRTVAGRRWYTVRSDRFTIRSDVSASFAAQASLVLDAAYEQVASALGLQPAERQQAVVFARRDDYRAWFRNSSGGCWDPATRTVYTYLDHAEERGFAEFAYPILVHEAAHAVLGTGVPADVPSWMHEGVACYFERWNPSRSVAHNRRTETGRFPRRPALLAARSEGNLPTLAEFLKLRHEWAVDDFGPRTRARYAMAEAVFVHLMDDPARTAIVPRMLAALRAGRDPAEVIPADEVEGIDAAWRRAASIPAK